MFAELALAALATFVCYLYCIFWRSSDYWKRRGVAQPAYNAFPLGNNPFTQLRWIVKWEHCLVQYQEQYNQFYEDKFYGTYGLLGTQPIFILKDLDLIKSVLGKIKTFFTIISKAFYDLFDPILLRPF
jgi:hypothetical protein